jgi:hypothetical protein
MNVRARPLLAAAALATLVAAGSATAAIRPAAEATAQDGARRAQQHEQRQERRKERKDARVERREERREDRTVLDRNLRLGQQQARQERREDRQEFRQDRREDRQEFRQDRREDRQAFRQDRREDRQEARHDRRHDRRDDRRDDRRIAYQRYRADYDRRARHVQVRVVPRYYLRPAHYRYFYGGTWYTTSNYGADVLRQAVDWGYREGLRAGHADRYDGWPADFRQSIAWRDGGFGYGGRYVSRADYAYYFRQGFERGYEDGYFGRMRYGRYDRNEAVIAEAVVAAILGFQLLR